MANPTGMPPKGLGPQGRGRLEEDDEDAVERDLMDIIPERLTDDRDLEDESRRGKSLLMAALLIGLAVVGAAAWYLLTGSSAQDGRVAAPTIPADQQPYKVRPADPGGMQVPNQDKMVYDRIDQTENTQGKVEKLLPEAPVPQAPTSQSVPSPSAQTQLPTLPAPTEPREPSIVKSGSKVGAPPSPPLEDVAEGTAGGSPAITPPTAMTGTVPGVEKPVPSPTTAVPPSGSKASAPLVKTEPSATAGAVTKAPAAVPGTTDHKSVSPTIATGGTYAVQLGALRDEASARKTWETLKAKHPGLLGGLAPQIEKADLKEKGVFYRLRATGIANEKAARTLCEELSKKNVGCLFVGK